MLQEIFAGSLIGLPDVKFNALSADQRVVIAGIAAGFAGLLSLFNIGGRLLGVAVRLYRPQEYLLHILRSGHHLLFVDAMVGGPRFEGSVCSGCLHHPLDVWWLASLTVPAYLADMFGTQFVGAIHGRHC